MDSEGRPCRCGPGVVHAPVDPQFLEKQIAKSADALAKAYDAQIIREVYGEIVGELDAK